MSEEIKIGIIGLDTSHTPEFVRLIQGEKDGIAGLHVAKALRFPSVFHSEKGQDERQAALEGWGVRMCSSIEETVEGMDAIFVEINDPSRHADYFEPVAGLGLPVFIDKPLAGSIEEGRRILACAERHSTRVWSASSLRFIRGLQAAKAKVPAPVCATVFGALGKAAAGSDLIWYGVHAAEMLQAVMGPGARSVRALNDETGVILAVDYGNGRRGVVECTRGLYHYGGRLQGPQGLAVFDAEGEVFYANLLEELRKWLMGAPAPLTLRDAFEVLAILDAGERSLVANGAPVECAAG